MFSHAQAEISALQTTVASSMGVATRVTDAASACTADTEGAVRYDEPSKDVMVCNSKTWVPVWQQPLGSPGRPAASCAAIADAGDARPGVGLYVLDVAGDQRDSFKAVCDMSTRTMLGGDGGHERTPALSCAFVLQYFPDEALTGPFWLRPAGARTSMLRACVRSADGSTFTEAGGDGTAQERASPSCAVLKHAFGAAPGVYWIGASPSSAQQELCDTEHPDGVSLGGDGSTRELASQSCASVYTHQQTSTGRIPPSAVYWLRNGTEAYQAYCMMSPTGATYMGGDGSRPERASFNCSFLYQRWSPPSGVFFLASDLSDLGTVAQTACDMSDTAKGLNVGGDGTSAASAAKSCRGLFEVFGKPTGSYVHKKERNK